MSDPRNQVALLAAGWRFAAITGGAEMVRMLDMYRELGIEVTTVAVDPATYDGCCVCFEGVGELYRVYTRPAA